MLKDQILRSIAIVEDDQNLAEDYVLIRTDAAAFRCDGDQLSPLQKPPAIMPLVMPDWARNARIRGLMTDGFNAALLLEYGVVWLYRSSDPTGESWSNNTSPINRLSRWTIGRPAEPAALSSLGFYVEFDAEGPELADWLASEGVREVLAV